MQSREQITLGISACLLGQAVRYDGSHKLNPYIVDTLGEVFDFSPYCPEVAIGLGVPRPPIHMVRVGETIRLQTVSGPTQEFSAAMHAYADVVADRAEGLSGFLFKSRSPSCGMEAVEIFSASGAPVDSGPGLFAAALMQRYPAMPVEDEARLQDTQRRENFIERVFLYHRWQQLRGAAMGPQHLVEFHTRHKFSLLAHDEPAYRELGRVVAELGRGDMADVSQRYIVQFMRAMQRPATPGSHCNVLQHLMGFIKGRLSAVQKQQLLEAIEAYRQGHQPLSGPIKLLRQLLRLYPNGYLQSLYYLYPDPREWALRGLA